MGTQESTLDKKVASSSRGISLESVSMSMALRQCLTVFGNLETLGEVADRTSTELMGLQGFNAKLLMELEEVLFDYGLSLADRGEQVTMTEIPDEVAPAGIEEIEVESPEEATNRLIQAAGVPVTQPQQKQKKKTGKRSYGGHHWMQVNAEKRWQALGLDKKDMMGLSNYHRNKVCLDKEKELGLRWDSFAAIHKNIPGRPKNKKKGKKPLVTVREVKEAVKRFEKDKQPAVEREIRELGDRIASNAALDRMKIERLVGYALAEVEAYLEEYTSRYPVLAKGELQMRIGEFLSGKERIA